MERHHGLVLLGAGAALVLSIVASSLRVLGSNPAPFAVLVAFLLLLTGGLVGAYGFALWVLWPISKYARSTSE